MLIVISNVCHGRRLRARRHRCHQGRALHSVIQAMPAEGLAWASALPGLEEAAVNKKDKDTFL